MHEIMQFILPIMAASAEVMFWVLIILALVVIGRGKILPSEKRLVIERQGKYKMDLAPGLNLAQPFLEAIASQITVRENTSRDDLLLCFEVRDKNIASRKNPFYLLNVSLQNGCLSFNASPAKLPALPVSSVPNAHGMAEDVENTIHTIAKSWGIGLQKIN